MNFRSAHLLMLLAAASAAAQPPEQFTNLQFFPKDISRAELIQTMRTFSFSLGMRCESCHEGPANKLDFASDAKERKNTARAMLRMVRALNHDYIEKLGPGKRVECATCHHGIDKPRSLQAVLTEELDAKGLPAAISLYRDLRKQYYGGAQYDFSETSLNLLTESLSRQSKTKEAMAFMELNAEVNSLSGWGRNLLAMAHRDGGETGKAIAEFESNVAKNPGDEWSKKELEKLKAAKH